MQPVMQSVPANTTYSIPSDNWLQDKETGYLYQPNNTKSCNPFTVEMKKAFIDHYRVSFPNMTEALEQVGTSRRTVFWHMKFDTRFREDIEEMREAKSDKIESALYQVACMPKPAAFMDRIAFLRAYRPGLYTEKRINLTGKDLDPSLLAHKSSVLTTVVDAELIEPGSQHPRPVISSQEGSKELIQKENPGPNS